MALEALGRVLFAGGADFGLFEDSDQGTFGFVFVSGVADVPSSSESESESELEPDEDDALTVDAAPFLFAFGAVTVTFLASKDETFLTGGDEAFFGFDFGVEESEEATPYEMAYETGSNKGPHSQNHWTNRSSSSKMKLLTHQ